MTAAGVAVNDTVAYDGENMFDAIAGIAEPERERPLYWLRPPDRPGYNGDNDPDLAIRKGDYKLLMDIDGSNVQLYNIVTDEEESVNLAEREADLAGDLAKELMEWYRDYPHAVDFSKMTH
jgi:arylsulfatase A-like enzyme